MKRFVKCNIKTSYELSQERLATIVDSIASIIDSADVNDDKIKDIERILKFYDLL